MDYLTYAEFVARVEAIDAAYLSSVLGKVTANAAERQTWCETYCLAYAESVVNAHVSKQRSVPVPSSSQYYPMIEGYVLAIAWYRVEFVAIGPTVREKLRTAYEDAMFALRDIAKGTTSIVDDEGDGPGTTEGTSLYVDSDTADMDADNLGEYF